MNADKLKKLMIIMEDEAIIASLTSVEQATKQVILGYNKVREILKDNGVEIKNEEAAIWDSLDNAFIEIEIDIGPIQNYQSLKHELEHGVEHIKTFFDEDSGMIYLKQDMSISVYRGSYKGM
jgi:hypothetical protein